MVLVAFSVDFVAVGFFFYSYGVFFNAIAKEFGGSHLGASLGLTVTHAGAVAAPMVGRALDRFPLRRVIAVGVCINVHRLRLLSRRKFAVGILFGPGRIYWLWCQQYG